MHSGVSERASAPQVADADDDIRLDPLRSALAESGDWRAVGSQPRNVLTQSIAASSLESEESAAGKLQAVIALACEQGDRCTAALVDLGPDQDEPWPGCWPNGQASAVA